jgi:hypothetical protein
MTFEQPIAHARFGRLAVPRASARLTPVYKLSLAQIDPIRGPNSPCIWGLAEGAEVKFGAAYRLYQAIRGISGESDRLVNFGRPTLENP